MKHQTPMQLTSSYRLQLTNAFTFQDAEKLCAYLEELGISHLYLSPILQAKSPHGYDVVNPTIINSNLGGSVGLKALIETLRSRGLGCIIDFVPNHMSTSHKNPFFWDTLQNGQHSKYAHWFDIDWDQKLQLPVLGASLEKVIINNELQIVEGELHYFEHRFPLRPETDESKPIEKILDSQHYELVHWRQAEEHISYRRFFDINELIGLRVEDESVFEEVHRLLLRLCQENLIDGIRLDHIDGLLNPSVYLARLREHVGDEIKIFVEKILESDEKLPRLWPIDGTTGYEALNDLDTLFVNPNGYQELEQLFQAFSAQGWQDCCYEAKREVLERILHADTKRVSALAENGIPQEAIESALIEFTANFPRYRTYFQNGFSDSDREIIHQTLTKCTLQPLAYEFLSKVFLEEPQPYFIERFQQLSAPAAAKGIEDTAFYRHFPLASRNEVGGGPEWPHDQFHARNFQRARLHPQSLVAGTTHDTKRSSDVRSRLSVLSEVPRRWGDAVKTFENLASDLECPLPSARTRYLFYQTLFGVWPLDHQVDPSLRERLLSYMLKASREAKLETSWVAQDETFENTLLSFIDLFLSDEECLEALRAFSEPLIRSGLWKALARLTAQLTIPGTPDIYQGEELWNFSLVDPDNRRAVDFNVRKKMASEDLGSFAALWSTPEDGRVKFALMRTLLRLRRRHPELFINGVYEPLETPEGVVGFLRFVPGLTLAVFIPQYFVECPHLHKPLSLPNGSFRCVFTGERKEKDFYFGENTPLGVWLSEA